MVSMAWVVTFWNGEDRQVRQVETESEARAMAVSLRTRSDALRGTSSVPIRVMPLAVYGRMGALKAGDNPLKQCRHKCLLRLCIPCVSAEIEAQRSQKISA